MDFERVTYYSRDDFCFGMGLDKIESLTIPAFDEIDINDAIEFYQIHLYFEDKARSKYWTDEQYKEYEAKSKTLLGLTHRFFHALTEESIVQEYQKADISYCSPFWELFENDKLYQRISETAFNTLIHCEHVPVYEVFEKENIVKTYGKVLKQYIIDNQWCVDILIHFYEQDYTGTTKLYLPQELSGQEIVVLLDKYIDSEQVHTNNLNAIFHMAPNKLFPITDKLRLRAQRKYASEMEKMNKHGVTIQRGIEVAFSKEQKEEKQFTTEGNNCHLSYSIEWLNDTLDYPSILNNFLYIFEFADIPQMRASHVSVDSIGGTLEKSFRSSSSRVFPDYFGFQHINGMAALQMQAYYHFLKDKGIRYEEVLQWFYTEYLQKEFGCPELRVSFPSENTSILEKCQCICDSLEIVIKQFSQYANDKSIDFELLEISNDTVKFDQIPSLIEGKYLYGRGNDFKSLSHLMFSDQCLLFYIPRIHEAGKEYRCFFDLLQVENVYKSDFHEKDFPSLEYLEKFDLIYCDEKMQYHLKNKIKLTILKDLFQKEVISRWHYPPQAKSTIQQWIDAGILTACSTLLSVPESNYFSYLLNHEKYCNGLDIRNKYAHGKGQISSNEAEHINNYNILLRLLTILTIKINDEFCLLEERNGEKK